MSVHLLREEAAERMAEHIQRADAESVDQGHQTKHTESTWGLKRYKKVVRNDF